MYMSNNLQDMRDWEIEEEAVKKAARKAAKKNKKKAGK